MIIDMSGVETKLRQAAKELFDAGEIDVLIGYARGTLPLRSRPCFLRNADSVEKLVWNVYCSNNLAVYLPRFFEVQPHMRRDAKPPPRVGIVAKGCEMRSVVGLVKEKQAPRENVVAIGVPCTGMVDPLKVERSLGGESLCSCVVQADGRLLIKTRLGVEQSMDRGEVLADACLDCRYPAAEGADVVIEGQSRETGEQLYRRVDEFEAMSVEERWRYFQEEISKCIRCYACRQACPNCYCKVCFADQTKPRWIGAGTELSDVMLYHIGRIFHQAGRCVECDACLRACPMNIDLRTFTLKMAKDVKELFDYTPGLSIEELPPLCTFKEDDSQEFITEP